MNRMFKRLGSWLATIGIMSLLLSGWLFRQDIFDWLRLRNYEPPAAIEQLAAKTTMSNHAKRLFYVYRPSLEPKTSFNAHCSESERTIVLGCYVSGKGIYVYDITDERLAGIEEVTAAHEMLHVAYERLKPQEKQRVNNLLSEAIASVKSERILSTVAQYRAKDPNIVPNELHSILGTEVGELPGELETYYKRYFNNRGQVVAFSRQYEKAFSERRDKVEAIDVSLSELKNQIERLEGQLESQSATLMTERARMDNLLKTENIEAYNDAVPGYNQGVNNYNASVVKVRSLIETYNSLVKERNALVLEENELIKAIDSRPQTLNSQ